MIQQRFTYSFSYDVHFTEGLFDPENGLLAGTVSPDGEAGAKRLLFVLDDGLLAHHPDLPAQVEAYVDAHSTRLVLAASPVVVPGGEAAKQDPAIVERLHRIMFETGLCRHSYVVAVGGGAVLDMAGYAAATAHRGIRLIRVPTTVLSQNDSAIGVKNGVNAYGSKNFLGTFAPPYAVLNDFTFLETLEDRDWRAGISEAVKVALIKDPAFFRFLHENAQRLAPPERDRKAMERLVVRCAELHLEHIATSGDPFELGSSRPLDFGHWAAHKLEQLTDFQLRHGEAVAIGIALDATYSMLAGMLEPAALEQILDLLKACGFTLYIPQLDMHLEDPAHPRSLFRGLEEFREHLGGELTIMLLEDIGQGVEVHSVELGLYRDAVARLRELIREH